MRHLGTNLLRQVKNKNLNKPFQEVVQEQEPNDALWKTLDELTMKQTKEHA